jgi:DNA-binding NtrC family response regulator
MERVRALIRRAASSEATVLIVGESGTGKELVARALHSSGPRLAGPFVDVNSAALTESLLESELFGHEKGAFTSAIARRRGKFEQAHGGTLFLDEIGDMPLPTQAKMLRVLQERSFQRVGGDERISVDVRVICATNRTLDEEAQKGTFRKDLFYRINTLVIDLPPLRQRVTDIPELARHFLARFNREEKRDVKDFSTHAMETLCAHGWPGNVRELQHAVERAVLVCEGDEIQPEHLPPAVSAGKTAPPPVQGGEGLIETVERIERSMILAALEKNAWVKARAARALGVTERILSYKINNLGIGKSGA